MNRISTFVFYLLIYSIIALLLPSCGDSSTSDPMENPMENFSFNTPAQGCASFNVFRYSDNGLSAISVSGNRDNLNLNGDSQAFDVNSEVHIEILEFDGEVNSHYCDDVLTQEDPTIIKTWTWESGSTHIQILEDSIVVNPWEVHFRIKVELENVELKNEDGETTMIEMIFEDVMVGWLPG